MRLLTTFVLLVLVTPFTLSDTFESISLGEDSDMEYGIRETKHNLGEFFGRELQVVVDGEDSLGICVWCHTQSINSSYVAATLKWAPYKIVKSYNLYAEGNKSLLKKKGIAPSSILCLSCHDGANAYNIVLGENIMGYSVHSHPVFVVYKMGSYYLKPYNSPLLGWLGKKHFIYDLIKDYEGILQCTSCHDPHLTTDFFLRAEKKGSTLCLGCHDL